MKKERLIAIIFGFFLGAILSLFFIIIKNLLDNQTIRLKENLTPTPLQNLSQTKKLNFIPLTVLSPPPNLIVDQDQIEIKIKLNKESLVIIQSPIKELSFYSKKDNLTTNFPLTLGENVIEISVYPKNKILPIESKIIKVYYLKN